MNYKVTYELRRIANDQLFATNSIVLARNSKIVLPPSAKVLDDLAEAVKSRIHPKSFEYVNIVGIAEELPEVKKGKK
jgi:hypothetical protein